MEKKKKRMEQKRQTTLHQLQERIKAKQEEVVQLESALSSMKEMENKYHFSETEERITQHKKELKYPLFCSYYP